MSFKAGDKVVCVEDGTLLVHERCLPRVINKGPEIYCVTECTYDGHLNFPDRIRISGFLRLCANKEIGFNAHRFRLVHRCKDSVSVEQEAEA